MIDKLKKSTERLEKSRKTSRKENKKVTKKWNYMRNDKLPLLSILRK